jgi:hypothetical protein
MDKDGLIEKYGKAWERSLVSMPASFPNEQRPTNPLLLAIPEGLIEANIKILFFGQETNDWEGLFPHSEGIHHLIATYTNFYLNGLCLGYGGQFWNGISKLKQKFEMHLAHTDRTVSFSWNNLVKIGKYENRGLPSEEILQWQDHWFDIIREEVILLRPDAAIFFTGPYCDRFIHRIFDDVYSERINERNERQLARVRSLYLPFKTIRTYHPNYLWRNGFYKYLDEIVNEIYC